MTVPEGYRRVTQMNKQKWKKYYDTLIAISNKKFEVQESE